MPKSPETATPAGLPLVHPSAIAWFLDVDGTLLELAPTPSSVRSDDRLQALLSRLHAAADGALALISGRTVAAIDGLFAPYRFAVAGQHGCERRDAGGGVHRHPPADQGLAAARHAMATWAAERPGVLLEDKGFSLALHYRQAPEVAEAAQDFLSAILAAGDGGLRLQPGKMVFEVKPAGRDKGMAIAEFMEEAPFRGRRPVFVGDDATDEYGFKMVNRLGGVSVKVGEGASVASSRLPDVSAVRDWLAAVAAGA
jgi:trehalose 6-phosphate phosphatase